MIFALTLLCASVTYEKHTGRSEYVDKVLPYVNKNFKLLLPEYKNTDTKCVFKDADLVIENGFRIVLETEIGQDRATFGLQVSSKNEISLTRFEFIPNNNGMIGGWEVQGLDYDPNAVYACIKEYMHTLKDFASHENTLLVRTKSVEGLQIHIVYLDTNGKVHSIVMQHEQNNDYKVLSSDSF